MIDTIILFHLSKPRFYSAKINHFLIMRITSQHFFYFFYLILLDKYPQREASHFKKPSICSIIKFSREFSAREPPLQQIL